MKKLVPIFAVVPYLFFLSSCKDDDVSPIVGVWTLSSETSTNCDDPADNSSDTYTCTSTDCYKLTLTGDGKAIIESKESGDTISIEGTYSTSGNQLTVCVLGSCGDPVQYTISGSTLTIITTGDFGCTDTSVLKK